MGLLQRPGCSRRHGRYRLSRGGPGRVWRPLPPYRIRSHRSSWSDLVGPFLAQVGDRAVFVAEFDEPHVCVGRRDRCADEPGRTDERPGGPGNTVYSPASVVTVSCFERCLKSATIATVANRCATT